MLKLERATAFFESSLKKAIATGIIIPPPPTPPTFVMNTTNIVNIKPQSPSSDKGNIFYLRTS